MMSGFPLLTTKKISLACTFLELKWFLSGSTNVNDLDDRVRHWWSPWADGSGDLGPIYGAQIRGNGDQLQTTLHQIINNPNSRRIIWSTWNASQIDQMKLPPCHGLVTQFKVYEDTAEISLSMYQRSADIFLGVPYNIASYALLLHIVAWATNLIPKELVMTFGDVHLYTNHFQQAKSQLTRTQYKQPVLCIKDKPRAHPLDMVLNLDLSEVWTEGYRSHPAIVAPLAI
jgi:thymidylate synthase